jgi:YHS domain-containing protein
MRFLLWLLVGYIAYRFVKAALAGKPAAEQQAYSGEETSQDPVCGVYVARDDAVIGTLNGERIHFCSMQCLEKYRERITNK